MRIKVKAPERLLNVEACLCSTAEVLPTMLRLCSISLQEAIAISRTFAAMKGYHIEGNKEVSR